MKTYFFIFMALVLIVLFTPKHSFAQADVASDAQVRYEIDENGRANVEYQITLKNIFTDRYAKAYTLQLEGTDPQNITVSENGSYLEYRTESFGGTTKINIDFPEALVGQNKTRTFTVSYIDTSFTHKNGEVWDVSIPRLGDAESFRSYDIALSVPDSFGEPAYISPEPVEVDKNTFKFNKKSIAATGVHAAFGKFQVYDIELKYHLENPLQQNTSIEIALPPDTSYQRIYISDMSPKPESLVSDEDGNWMATYVLKPREQIEVVLKANAQVFNSPIRTVEINDEVLRENLRPTKYWNTDDQNIKSLANKYKTPREIFDYVVGNLSYDHSRIVPQADRLGASASLKQPNKALCSEFTDLFIAISRAAGIPSREINGYAFSDNTSLNPLSLVTDVLHAWPEYWDEERKAWIAVDPTWQNTTGGIDYFNTMDLKHVAFAIHGVSDTLPYPAGSYKLGAFPEKNVTVQVGKLPASRESYPEIKISPLGRFPITKQKYEVSIYNPGPSALYDIPVLVSMDEEIAEKHIDALLPFGTYRFNQEASVGFLASDMPEKITVSVSGISSSMATQKADIALYHSASVLLVVLAFAGGIFLYFNGHHISPKK